MIRQAYRQLAPHLDKAIRRKAKQLAVLASISGIMEAVALLLTVRVAISLGDDQTGDVEIPGLGRELSSGWLLLIALAAGVGVVLLHHSNANTIADVSSRVLDRLRGRAIRSYVAAGWPTQSLQREGALQETVTTLSIRTSLLVESMTTTFTQSVSLAVFIGAALAVDFVATGVVMVMGIVLIGCMRPISRATRQRSRAYVDANSSYAEDVSRLTSTSMELRVFGVQHVAERELAGVSDGVRRKQQRARSALLLAGGLYKDLAVLLLVACVGLLLLIDSGEFSSMAVVVTLMVRALASAQAVNHAYQAVNEGVSSVTAFNQRVAALDAGVTEHGRRNISRLSTISLDEVGYNYNDDVTALSGVSLTLDAGESLGVVGPSGGGKSTFVQVLLRLRPPTTGTVSIDGIDYTDFDDVDWARLVAFVPQEPTLLEGTIADNIRYYRDISQDDVEFAAASANVLTDILRQPNGFDTMLGPRGSGLSGGQKQRVAIARALVGRPRLLVMDEPSSALDVHSEQLLQATLSELKGSITTVIVAHRMKTVESCDRLLVIEDGRIAQLGAPDDLMRSDGFYRRVVETLS